MNIIKRVVSLDGITIKFLQELSDGFVVETTYINHSQKHIICISTQVGCVIGCTFCASGLRIEGKKYRRSLTRSELIKECLSVVHEIDLISETKSILFSFMGEGEPFLNFKALLGAFEGLVSREWDVPIKLAVSTSGIRPDLIRCLAKVELPVPLKLQVSLHGPTDEVRQKLVPVTKPLAEILAAVKYYREQCHRPVELNYVMCAGVNDGLEHAYALARILGPGWYIKFNQLNPTMGSIHQAATQKQVSEFCRILEDCGITTEYYETDGVDVKAACGQLSYHSSK